MVEFDEKQLTTLELKEEMTLEALRGAYKSLLVQNKDLRQKLAKVKKENEELRQNQPDLDLGIE